MHHPLFFIGAVASMVLVAAAGAGIMPAANQPESTTPRQTQPRPAEAGPAATPTINNPRTIKSLAFLAGTWIGDMNGTHAEEAWSAPRGNNIIGHFRWLRPDGKPIIFEILTITEEPDAIRLRLRHYSETLVAKEEQDKPMTLKLVSVSDSRAHFAAEEHAGDLRHAVYTVKGDTLTIDLDLGEERDPLVFRLTRQRVE